MYNGIGLNTVRGTGTSGHVQRHAAAIRRHGPDKREKRSAASRGSRGITKGTDAILRHERHRRVEVAVAEMEEKLIKQGCPAEEIPKKLARLREQLMENAEDAQFDRANAAEVQKIAEMQKTRNEKLRRVLRLPTDYKEGRAFERASKNSDGTSNSVQPSQTAAAQTGHVRNQIGGNEATAKAPKTGKTTSEQSSSSSSLSTSSSSISSSSLSLSSSEEDRRPTSTDKVRDGREVSHSDVHDRAPKDTRTTAAASDSATRQARQKPSQLGRNALQEEFNVPEDRASRSPPRRARDLHINRELRRPEVLNIEAPDTRRPVADDSDRSSLSDPREYEGRHVDHALGKLGSSERRPSFEQSFDRREMNHELRVSGKDPSGHRCSPREADADKPRGRETLNSQSRVRASVGRGEGEQHQRARGSRYDASESSSSETRYRRDDRERITRDIREGSRYRRSSVDRRGARSTSRSGSFDGGYSSDLSSRDGDHRASAQDSPRQYRDRGRYSERRARRRSPSPVNRKYLGMEDTTSHANQHYYRNASGRRRRSVSRSLSRSPSRSPGRREARSRFRSRTRSRSPAYHSRRRSRSPMRSRKHRRRSRSRSSSRESSLSSGRSSSTMSERHRKRPRSWSPYSPRRYRQRHCSRSPGRQSSSQSSAGSLEGSVSSASDMGNSGRGGHRRTSERRVSRDREDIDRYRSR